MYCFLISCRATQNDTESDTLSSDLPSLVPTMLPTVEQNDFDNLGEASITVPDNVSYLTSDLPSMVPSRIVMVDDELLSDLPSFVPSDGPSEVPSDHSFKESFLLSALPSDLPSFVPSQTPTHRPTRPSFILSDTPSLRSAIGPTRSPVIDPSSPAPSQQVTFMPSDLPSISGTVSREVSAMVVVTLQSGDTEIMNGDDIDIFETVCQDDFLLVYLPQVQEANYGHITCQVLNQTLGDLGETRIEEEESIAVGLQSVTILLRVSSTEDLPVDIVQETFGNYSSVFQERLSEATPYFFYFQGSSHPHQPIIPVPVTKPIEPDEGTFWIIPVAAAIVGSAILAMIVSLLIVRKRRRAAPIPTQQNSGESSQQDNIKPLYPRGLFENVENGKVGGDVGGRSKSLDNAVPTMIGPDSFIELDDDDLSQTSSPRGRVGRQSAAISGEIRATGSDTADSKKTDGDSMTRTDGSRTEGSTLYGLKLAVSSGDNDAPFHESAPSVYYNSSRDDHLDPPKRGWEPLPSLLKVHVSSNGDEVEASASTRQRSFPTLNRRNSSQSMIGLRSRSTDSGDLGSLSSTLSNLSLPASPRDRSFNRRKYQSPAGKNFLQKNKAPPSPANDVLYDLGKLEDEVVCYTTKASPSAGTPKHGNTTTHKAIKKYYGRTWSFGGQTYGDI